MMMSTPEGYREIERRQASSTIISEQYIGNPAPSGEVRYVEVPIVEEVVKKVTRREVKEENKIVPRYEIEYVDKVVEVPQVQYIDRVVEVPEIKEVIRHVTRKEYVDVPREVIKEVPKYETVEVTQVVEVPGEIIEVPKPYAVENKVQMARFVDKDVPMVVAQTIKPIITGGKEALDVDVFEYNPEVVVVDVHVPKPVPSQLIAAGLVEDIHRTVTVPAAQYNAMLKMLNTHITEMDQRSTLPFIIDAQGTVPMLYGSEATNHYPAADATAQIQGYIATNSGSAANVLRYVEMSSGMTVNVTQHTLAASQMGTHTTTTQHHYTSVQRPSQAISANPLTTVTQHNYYSHGATSATPFTDANVSRVQSSRA